MSSGDLSALQESLGHRFAHPDLLSRALTHASSVANGGEGRTYERLEFFGDRVLGLVVADMLDSSFPTASVGEISRRFHRLVSGETCAEVAREMRLDKVLRIAGGRPTTNVLGDVCESVIGAVYRDGGLAAAQVVIERYWRERLETVSARDAKTELQEWTHRRGFQMPVYEVVQRTGPDHAVEFEVEVSIVGAAPERGRGRSKREAEQEAAAAVLSREGVWRME